MAIWYRAHHISNKDVVFSGEGGLYVAGRWNYKGRKAIYCSQSLALCTLEWLSHNGLMVSGFSYHKYAITVPNRLIKKFTAGDLPQHWDSSPSSDSGRDFAETHLFQQTKYAAIAVPSVVIPEEYNLVINPLHGVYSSIHNTIEALGFFIAPER